MRILRNLLGNRLILIGNILVIGWLLIFINSCKDNGVGKMEMNVLTGIENSSSDSIQNPILQGFNPDPCILRVGSDYYIVTSTFEWFPGIPVYHSRDLVHWRQISYVLSSEKQLNLRGIGNSSGIFAPSIHFVNGKFYVLYTVVSGQFPFLASPNYIVSSNSINGPWSEPVYLNSTGFDPDLFVDDDGSAFVLNMQLDFYQSSNTGGIIMQAFNLDQMKLTGKSRNIFTGTCFGTEGPRIYKHNNWYYLFTAEGGTDWGHQVTVARSTSVEGPYEVDPNTPLITCKDDSTWPIQRAGHASLVETENGNWYIAYLGSRPVMPKRKSILGRESFLQKVEWTEDGWLRLSGGGNKPLSKVVSPGLPDFPFPELNPVDQFDDPELQLKYQSLRQSFSADWVNLKAKPGYLAIRGRKPFNNLDDQSMVMQRVTSLNGFAETSVLFEPESYRQMAGIMCFYDTRDFIFLKVSKDEKYGKYIGITHQQGASINTELDEKIPIPVGKPIYLKVNFEYDSLYFSYAIEAGKWNRIGPNFDFSQLSDENNKYGFTGTMVGPAVYDMIYEDSWAYFDYFTYASQ